jgi:fructokinase
VLVCVGELLIDFLPLGGQGGAMSFRACPGGAPLNVAVGLARLGQQVGFLGKVSTDVFGRTLRRYLVDEGVDTRFLLDADAPTTLAFVAMLEGEPSFAFYGDLAADTLLRAEEVSGALGQVSALHFGGISLLRGTTPAAVERLVSQLTGRALLSFDPNIRPGIVRNAAAYRARLERLFGRADLVKVSAADLAWFSPGVPPVEAAASLLDYGPAAVALTRGPCGAVLLRKDGQWTAPGFQVQVVDTVGAGDAFAAGLLAALAERGVVSRPGLQTLDGGEVVAVLRFASAVAALTCARAGANPPRRKEVQELLAAG